MYPLVIAERNINVRVDMNAVEMDEAVFALSHQEPSTNVVESIVIKL